MTLLSDSPYKYVNIKEIIVRKSNNNNINNKNNNIKKYNIDNNINSYTKL